MAEQRTPTDGEDLYRVLGVPRDADAEAIRKAYRKLARKYHPDVNPGDATAEESFKAVSRAYAVLSDEEKRRNYDEFGEVSLQSGFDADEARRMRDAFGARFGAGGGRPGHGAPPPGWEEFSFGDLDDLLGRAFGGGARRGPGGRIRFPGPDLHTEIRLDFLTAARGGERRLDFARPTADGGTRRESLTVRIPPGVSDGGQIRLAGKGGEGPGGGPAGDLYLTVRVEPHPLFRREGRDLHLDLPLSVAEATLGTEVSVPTLEGRVKLTVPAGTDSGRRLRVKGKGIPHPHGGAPGDLYATVQIRVPRDLDDDARAKLEALSRFDPKDLRRELE